MSGGLTKKQIQGIKKKLSRDYLAEKERRKQLRREKASRPKGEKHRSRQQVIEELVETEFELEGGQDDETQ